MLTAISNKSQTEGAPFNSMTDPPDNYVVFYPHDTGWDRGSSPIDQNRRWVPRLIHAGWRQVLEVEPDREEHTHDVYHIGLVQDGVSSMLFNSQVTPTQPGSLLVVSPGQPHCFFTPPGERSMYAEVTFEVVSDQTEKCRESMSGLLSDWAGWNCSEWMTGKVVDKVLQKTIADAIRRIVAACMLPPPKRAFTVNRGLLNLLEVMTEVDRPFSQAAVGPMVVAAQQLEENLSKPVSIEDIADGLGMSPSHLIRSFKQRYGVTPMAYRHQIQLDTAKQLLVSTHYPLKMIAHSTGFSSVHYFNRFFSQRVGTPPGTYRKYHQND
ncbi:MAG: AraC family transcriptional regulator [Planctomycetota bacterium]